MAVIDHRGIEQDKNTKKELGHLNRLDLILIELREQNKLLKQLLKKGSK